VARAAGRDGAVKIQTAFLCAVGSLLISSAGAFAVSQTEDVELRKYVAQKKCAVGIKLCDSILARQPNDARAYIFRGLFEAWSNQVAKGQADFRRALELNPREYEARVHLANTYIGQGKFDKATEEAQKIVQEAPDMAVGHHILAVLKMHDDKFAEALAILDKQSSRKNADLPAIAGDKLICLAGMKRFKEADLVLESVPDRKALQWWAIYSFANKMAGVGNEAGALYLAKRSPEKDEPSRIYLLVYCNANLGRVADAEKAYQLLYKLSPNYPAKVPNEVMAAMYERKHQFDKVIYHLNKIKKDELNYSLVEMRHNAHMKTLNFDEAINDLTVLVSKCASKSQKAYAYMRRGNIHAMMSQTDRAIADYTTAIALAPFDRALYLKRSELYEDTGDLKRAKADMAKYDALGRK
jgi:tetratricopeptide (TPR) repeat protein